MLHVADVKICLYVVRIVLSIFFSRLIFSQQLFYVKKLNVRKTMFVLFILFIIDLHCPTNFVYLENNRLIIYAVVFLTVYG